MALTTENLQLIVDKLTDAVLQMTVSETQTASVTVNGRTITYRSLEEINNALSVFEARLASQKGSAFRWKC